MAGIPYITGEDLRQIRAEKGLTQEDVAKFLGVTSRTVMRWERARVGAIPNPRLANRITQMRGWEPKWMEW